MRNTGFYDENGLLIDVKDVGITIKDLCNYTTGLELYDVEYKHADLLYLILNNFNLRRKYLTEYKDKTNDENEKRLIGKFLKNFDELNKKRREFFSYTKEINSLLIDAKSTNELEYNKIMELYEIIGNTYEQMINNNVSSDIAINYINTLKNLAEYYHKIYNYNMNMDPKFQEILDNFVNINKQKR